jgi:hypothetical protein
MRTSQSSRLWVTFVLAFVAAGMPACSRSSAPPVPATHAEDSFRRSDPSSIGATGRPQLLEFYHPT